MGLLDILFEDDTKKKNKENPYGLDEWEKDIVKKENYDPWNFEEEDLEEDDYYNEDES